MSESPSQLPLGVTVCRVSVMRGRPWSRTSRISAMYRRRLAPSLEDSSFQTSLHSSATPVSSSKPAMNASGMTCTGCDKQ